jgi:hypothetical protein
MLLQNLCVQSINVGVVESSIFETTKRLADAGHLMLIFSSIKKERFLKLKCPERKLAVTIRSHNY